MIYIVEDDAAIRELEQYALQSSGYQVNSFPSSEPFWQAMRTTEPELVILDVMLPGEDGFSILKKLRNQAFWHHGVPEPGAGSPPPLGARDSYQRLQLP